MTINLDDLNSFQLDALKEVSNIGAGNAATSLSKMLKKPIDMNVPNVQVLELNEVCSLIGDEEAVVVGIYLDMVGDIKGTIVLVIEYEAAKNLISILLQGYPITDDENELSEMALSALREMGNILAGSYISAICSLSRLHIMATIPNVAIDMAAAILAVPALGVAAISDKVLYIGSEFEDGEQKGLGSFFLIPDMDSYGILLNALGVII